MQGESNLLVDPQPGGDSEDGSTQISQINKVHILLRFLNYLLSEIFIMT